MLTARPSSSRDHHLVINSSSNRPPHAVDDDSIQRQTHRRRQGKKSKHATTALRSFLSDQWFLCSQLPILILIVVASLDNADKQLLASSFPILEKLLRWDIQQLGYFSLCTNLSYALSLPLWGWLIHHRSSSSRRHRDDRHPTKSPSSSSPNGPLVDLLAQACTAWGLATVGIATVTLLSASSSSSSSSPWLRWLSPDRPVSRSLQVIVRSINGMALGSILPLSQSLLAEYTPNHLRGQAFGLMGVGEKLAGTLASSAVVFLGEDHWQYAYYSLGIASIVAGVMARHVSLHPPAKRRKEERGNLIIAPRSDVATAGTTGADGDDDGAAKELPLRQIVERIVRLPAFVCLVAQGVFGGTPWDMMSFLLLLMDWRGFTRNQVVAIQISSGMSSMLGGWIGGVMGDHAAALSASWGSGGHDRASGDSQNSQGRILLALVSVVGGIPLYGFFLYATNFSWAMVWINLFSIWATWTPPGAIRPICADLTDGPSERAQIVALWIVLEKVSGAVFGAPLVGYLTYRMLANDQSTHNASTLVGPNNEDNDEFRTNGEKAHALAFNLFLLSSIFWSICAFCWVVMFLTMRGSINKRVSGTLHPQAGTVDADHGRTSRRAINLGKGYHHVNLGV